MQNAIIVHNIVLLIVCGFLLCVPAEYALDFVDIFLYFLLSAFEHVNKSNREAILLYLAIVLILLHADFQERGVNGLPPEEESMLVGYRFSEYSKYLVIILLLGRPLDLLIFIERGLNCVSGRWRLPLRPIIELYYALERVEAPRLLVLVEVHVDLINVRSMRLLCHISVNNMIH